MAIVIGSTERRRLQMNKFRFPVYVLAMAILTLAFASAARAQATRTWVSGVGDDANPCSRTAPCKTFAGAISKTAPGGEISVLDPGGFGSVTITKSITIDGGGGQIAGVLVSVTNGINVNAGKDDVVALRNLDIDGINGFGINGVNITAAKTVYIDHCQIYGFSQNAINDVRSTNPTMGPSFLFVNDCFIRANGGGIAVAGNTTNHTSAVIKNCYIQQSGFGIAASNTNTVDVLHCYAIGNAGDGVKVDTNAQAHVIGCVLNSNSGGAIATAGAIFLADTTIMNNSTGVSGAITTFGNNNVRNNAGGMSLPAPVGQQ
jgi:parallel beta helix pectate lyase-like protein